LAHSTANSRVCWSFVAAPPPPPALAAEVVVVVVVVPMSHLR
jgi:hypothetical protein